MNLYWKEGLLIHILSINKYTNTIFYRQADALLERLLTRMSLSNSVSQRRNLAFCISELTVTEKGIKKMIELIKYVYTICYINIFISYILEYLYIYITIIDILIVNFSICDIYIIYM